MHYKKPLWTSRFLSLCFSSFFIFLPFYALLTALPFYVLEDLKESQQSVGLVISIFLLAAVLVRPFAGNLLDTHGRKKILFISLVILLVSTAAYSFVTSYSILLLVRFVQGIGFGFATTATGAIAADIIPDERKGEGMGYYGLFMSLAMIIGPYLGLTIIQQSSFSVLFILCTVFAVLSFLLGLNIKLPAAASKPVRKEDNRFTLELIFEKSALPISITAAFLAFAYSSILSFVSLYAAEIGLESIAGLFFVVFAVMVILSRPFVGKWFDLYGENRIVYPALVIFLAGLVILSFTGNGLGYLIAGGIIGLGYGAVIPSFQTISIQSASPQKRGMATATYFIFFDSGIGIGAFFNGIISAAWGYETMYWIAAASTAFCILLYSLLYARNKKRQVHQGVTA